MSDFSIEVLVKNLFINGSAIKEIAKLLNAHKSAISEMIEVTGFTRQDVIQYTKRLVSRIASNISETSGKVRGSFAKEVTNQVLRDINLFVQNGLDTNCSVLMGVLAQLLDSYNWNQDARLIAQLYLVLENAPKLGKQLIKEMSYDTLMIVADQNGETDTNQLQKFARKRAVKILKENIADLCKIAELKDHLNQAKVFHDLQQMNKTIKDNLNGFPNIKDGQAVKKGRNQELINKILKLSKNNNKLKEEIENQKSTSENKDKQIEQLLNDNKQLQKQLKDLQKELTNYEDMNKTLQTTIGRLKQDYTIRKPQNSIQPIQKQYSSSDSDFDERSVRSVKLFKKQKTLNNSRASFTSHKKLQDKQSQDKRRRSYTPNPKSKLDFPFKKQDSPQTGSVQNSPKLDPTDFIDNTIAPQPRTIIPVDRVDINTPESVLQRERQLVPISETAYLLKDGILTYQPGPVRLSDDTIYMGSMTPQTNFRHGFGIQVFSDGSKYIGTWKSDSQHGFGRKINVDGSYYEGEWCKGTPNGKGKLVKFSGGFCEGMWRNGKLHGQAFEKQEDGTEYTGEFVNGLKQGKGELKLADGSKYIGQFYQNFIHGHGRYDWADGRSYEGEWAQGKMHNKGVFTWKDGSMYEGDYIYDKKEGYGIFKWSNQKRYEGMWKNGKQHGEGILYVGSKTLRGVWENGKRVNK